jgi:flagellar biosynthetic protein FliQ
MVNDFITQITRESLYLVITASAPPILISLIVGFIISIFQATTQIQEQTLTFAPKLVVVFGVLALAGPWIGSQLVRFTFEVFDRFPQFVHG